MKKEVIKLALLLVLSSPVFICAQQRWYSDIGKPGEDENCHHIIETYDKGYFLSGDYWNEHGMLYKLSVNGEYLWDKVFISGVFFDNIYANCEFENARQILAGHAGPDPVIISLNACGELE